MTTIFGQSVKPPNAKSPFGIDEKGQTVGIAFEHLAFLQQLWSWAAVGYVTIPCDVGGTADAIELTPRFRPEIAASGYVDLLAFSFVAGSTTTAATTIQVIGTVGDLDAVPAYVGAVAAGAGDFVAGVPYVVFFCEAVASLSLPDRMVRK